VSACYEGQQFVGIDLHRRRTVLVRMTAAGERLGSMVRFPSTPEALRREMAAALSPAGPAPEVVLEATYGWYWAVETLQQLGARVHLAHPLGIKGFTTRRVKNDERDATDLADLLRMGRLPEAHIAAEPVRALRELVRHRAKLSRWRSAVKTSIHAVLAKRGVPVPMSDLFGAEGTALLDALCGRTGAATGKTGKTTGKTGGRLEPEYAARVVSLRGLLSMLDGEIAEFDRRIATALAGHPGFRTLQQISGVGPVFAAVFVAEIGDVARFSSADKLTCWAGLTPRHRESDTTVHRGRVTKQGSKLVRWAAVEAVQRSSEPAVDQIRTRIADRRGRPGQRTGRNIAKVAAARVLLKLVYYGLRDGEIRALGSTSAPGSAPRSGPGPRSSATTTVA
jgi:transposase